MNMHQRQGMVHSDPETQGGTPVFVGTPVLLQYLVDNLEGGETIEDFLAAFPTVRRDQALPVIMAAVHGFKASGTFPRTMSS